MTGAFVWPRGTRRARQPHAWTAARPTLPLQPWQPHTLPEHSPPKEGVLGAAGLGVGTGEEGAASVGAAVIWSSCCAEARGTTAARREEREARRAWKTKGAAGRRAVADMAAIILLWSGCQATGVGKGWRE